MPSPDDQQRAVGLEDDTLLVVEVTAGGLPVITVVADAQSTLFYAAQLRLAADAIQSGRTVAALHAPDDCRELD